MKYIVEKDNLKYGLFSQSVTDKDEKNCHLFEKYLNTTPSTMDTTLIVDE